MKLTQLDQGTSVPQNISNNASRLDRAKLIAQGKDPSVIQKQVENIVIKENPKKIKMKTNASIFRDNPPEVQEELNKELSSENTLTQESNTSETKMVSNESPNISNNEGQGSEETKPIDPQLAALAKQKRALQVKERELAQREEALKASKISATADDVLARLKTSPLEVLLENGVTYDQLTEAILNSSPQQVDPAKLKNDLKESLKQEILEEFSNRDKLQEKQVLDQISREIDLVTATGDEFEAIRHAKAQSSVVDLIHRTFQKTGEVLDTLEAAKLVEEQLIEDSLPLVSLKKVQSRISPPQQEEIMVEETKPIAQIKTIRTLTNRDGARPTLDRKARAIAAFNGTLKRG